MPVLAPSTEYPAPQGVRPGGRSRRRKVIFSLILAAILFAVTIVLLELALRLLPTVLSEPQKSVFEESSRIGLSNTRMYRGTQVLLPPPQQADILVVGDSFPFGTYVRVADTFPMQLGKLLQKNVVNLGVASTGPAEYNRMVEVGFRYAPQTVIYCIFANDFEAAVNVRPRVLSTDNGQPSGKATEGLYLEELTPRDRFRVARKHVSNLFLSLQIFKMRQQESQRLEHVPYDFAGGHFMFAPRAYWDPKLDYNRPEIARSVGEMVEMIRAVDTFCRQNNARLVVMLIPSKEMAFAWAPGVGEKIYAEGHGRTYQELASRIGGIGVPCLDLTEPMRSEAMQGRKYYFTIDGHFNESGHAAVAGMMAEFLGKLAPVVAPVPRAVR